MMSQPRTNMDKFFIERIIFFLKHIYNYNTGLLMHKYINNMTPDVLNNFFPQ